MRSSGMRRKGVLGICSLLLAGVGLLAQALPSTAVTTPNAYVALGDSYAAGPGIPNVVHSACQRSDHNYPHLVAVALGAGRFTDDIDEGALESVLVRSPYAHARIKSIDVAAARALPGVIAVYTAQDLPFGATDLPILIPHPNLTHGRTQRASFLGYELMVIHNDTPPRCYR